VTIRHRLVLTPTTATAWLRPNNWNEDHVVEGDAGGGATSVSHTFTSPQLLSLYTTPIVLVAGVPDTILVPTLMVAHYRAGSSAYAGSNSITIGTPDFGGYCYTTEDLLTGPSWVLVSPVFTAFQPGTGGPADLLVGAPLQARMTGADPTAGDGELDLTLWYYEVAA
jgi:hypothetical protein